jgi:hypothetical protein
MKPLSLLLLAVLLAVANAQFFSPAMCTEPQYSTCERCTRNPFCVWTPQNISGTRCVPGDPDHDYTVPAAAYLGTMHYCYKHNTSMCGLLCVNHGDPVVSSSTTAWMNITVHRTAHPDNRKHSGHTIESYKAAFPYQVFKVHAIASLAEATPMIGPAIKVETGVSDPPSDVIVLRHLTVVFQSTFDWTVADCPLGYYDPGTCTTESQTFTAIEGAQVLHIAESTFTHPTNQRTAKRVTWTLNNTMSDTVPDGETVLPDTISLACHYANEPYTFGNRTVLPTEIKCDITHHAETAAATENAGMRVILFGSEPWSSVESSNYTDPVVGTQLTAIAERFFKFDHTVTVNASDSTRYPVKAVYTNCSEVASIDAAAKTAYVAAGLCASTTGCPTCVYFSFVGAATETTTFLWDPEIGAENADLLPDGHDCNTACILGLAIGLGGASIVLITTMMAWADHNAKKSGYGGL